MDTKTDADQNKKAEPAKRHLTNEIAQLEVYGKSGKVYCRMINLSASGAFFEIINSSHTPRGTDLIRVKVNLRQINRVHTLFGEVVWSKGLGVGIKFINYDTLVGRLIK